MRRIWNANTHYHDLVLRSIPPGASRVLDVGCGDGLLAADLVRHGVTRVVALDADAAVLERARQRHAGMAVEWMLGDVFDAPLIPGSFDAVVSVATLHHLDARRALARFAELVRPGGTVAIVGLAANEWSDVPLAGIGVVARTTIQLLHGASDHSAPQCWPPPLTYREVRQLADELMPGSAYRRLLLNRFSLVWRKP